MPKRFIDRLVLGTAQLGTEYGITVDARQEFTNAEALRILETAWDVGVRVFDTAPVYGSERILGSFIRAHGIETEIKVCTKISRQSREGSCRSAIQDMIGDSMTKLGVESLHVLFFHHVGDIHPFLNDYEFIEETQKRFSISKVGVSVYELYELDRLRPFLSSMAIQFPMSLANRAFQDIDLRPAASFARSVFLQGVLVENTTLNDRAPKRLRTFRNRYLEILRKEGISPVQYALSYAVSQNLVDHIIVGVQTPQQLKEIVGAQPTGFKKVMQIENLLSRLDHDILDPRQWS